jgi:hypothetical protein
MRKKEKSWTAGWRRVIPIVCLVIVVAASAAGSQVIGRGELGVRVTYLPVPEGYVVYWDPGIPAGSEIWTWDGSQWGMSPATFDGDYTGETPPEGVKCFRTQSGSGVNNYAGWGVFLAAPSDHTVDLSGYSELRFWVKVSEDACVGLYVQVQQGSRSGPKSNRLCVNLYGWTEANTWQEIRIPRSAFTGVDFTRIFSPFIITIEKGDATFYVDNVRWV